MINYWKEAQTPKPGEKPKVQENNVTFKEALNMVNPLGWVVPMSRAMSDAYINYFRPEYQADIDAANQRQRELDNQLLQATRKNNRPLPKIYGTGQQNLERDVLNRNLTTPEEARNAFIAAAGTATMGFTPGAQLAGATGKLISNAAARTAASTAIPTLAKASATKKLLGYGALRGAENALPGIVVNTATGTPVAETAKRAGIDFATGAVANTVLSPKLTVQAGKETVGAVKASYRINKDLIPTLDAPIPQYRTIDLGNQGQKIQEPFDAEPVDVPNSHIQFYANEGRLPKPGEVVPSSYATEGTSKVWLDPKDGSVVSWSTDNPQFAQNVTSKQLSWGNTVRRAKPSELPDTSYIANEDVRGYGLTMEETKGNMRPNEQVPNQVNLLSEQFSGSAKSGSLGRQLDREATQVGYQDIRGTKITSPGDIASALKDFRNPRQEYLHLVYVDKNGKVVGHNAYTADLIDAAGIPKFKHEVLYKINDRMRRLGADGLYLAHNHPSGSSLPSQADRNFTQFFKQRFGNKFKSQVVLDHNEATILNANYDGVVDERITDIDLGKSYESKEASIGDAEGFTRLVDTHAQPKPGEATIFITDSHLRPVGYKTVRFNPDSMEQTTNQALREYSGQKAFLAINSADERTLTKLAFSGKKLPFQDVAVTGGQGNTYSLYHALNENLDPDLPRRRRIERTQNGGSKTVFDDNTLDRESDLGTLHTNLREDKLIKNISQDQVKAESQVIRDTVGYEGIQSVRRVVNSRAYKNGQVDFTSVPKYDVILDDLKTNHPYLTDGMSDTEIMEMVAKTTASRTKIPVKRQVTTASLERGGKNMAEPGLSDEELISLERSNPSIRQQQSVDRSLRRGKNVVEPNRPITDEELASLDRTLKNEPGYQNVPGTATRTAKNGEKITIRDKAGNPIEVDIQTAVLNAIAKKKDKGAFALNNQTPVRNMEDIFGDDAPLVKANTTDLLAKNETARLKWQDSEITDLRNRFERLGVQAGSEEDTLAFRFAEKRMSLSELKAAAPERWKQIKEVADTARERYDGYLAQINEQLVKYGYDPVPKRADYITHLNELNVADGILGNLLNAEKGKLPTIMASIHMNTKPGRAWFGFGKEREGGLFKESVLDALDAYIPSASKQIFHTETIQSARNLEKVIQGSVSEGQKALSNFNSWYSQWVNTVAGKGSDLDRSLEKIAGRNAVQTLDALRRRTSANMIGANISSALTNFIPLTQSIATTGKVSAARGLAEAAGAPFSKTANLVDGVESSFLTRRFKGTEKIAKPITEKVTEGAGWLFQAVDRLVSKAVVGGKYYEGISKGLSKAEAMKQADDYAARLIADRSLGQTPTLYNSKMAGLLTQYQLEVNNQLSFLGKDLPKLAGGSAAKAAWMLGQVAVYSYVYNYVMENIVGRRPAIDPIGVATDTYQDYSEGNKDATKNLIKNVSSQLPYVSTFTDGGRIPMSAAIPDVVGMFTGEANVKKELMKPAWYLLPPVGGGQAKKTIEGATAYNQGYSETETGKVRFPIEKTPANAARSYLFGQYSSPEARNYFKTGASTLSDKQSATFKALGASGDYYRNVMDSRKAEQERKATIEKLSKGGSGGDNLMAKLGYENTLTDYRKMIEDKELPDEAKQELKKSFSPSFIEKYEKAKEIEDAKWLVESGTEKQVTVGDKVVRTNPQTGATEVVSMKKIQDAADDKRLQYGMENAKEEDDLETYMKLLDESVEKKAAYLDTLDPELDADEIATVKEQITDLLQNKAKYSSYQGFKKPKKAKRLPVVKASFKTASAKIPTAPKPRTPKLKVAKGQVRKVKVARVRAPKI